MIKVLELFSGTKSIGKVCDQLGWESVSVDLIMEADHKCDIMDFDYKQYEKDEFDIVWASPPCTEYSKLQDGWLNRMRKGELYTKEIQEKHMTEGDILIKKTLEIINYFDCEYWFMENPQTGRLKDRDVVEDIPYYDVDYCKYCDWGYKKRTRIWTNRTDWENRLCNNDCDSVIVIPTNGAIRRDTGKPIKANKRTVHIKNLGKKQPLKHMDITNLMSKNHTTLNDRYRIPPNLIYSLFLD